MKFPFNQKKSIFFLISITATNFATYHFTKEKDEGEAKSEQSVSQLFANNTSNCSAVKVKRMDGYNFIKPMLFVDEVCESDKLQPIKVSVTTLINEYKRIGAINSASIFLKEYSGNEWISINKDEKFLPGSLMKVPELITFLKMEEANPGILEKKLLFNKTYTIDKHPKYVSKEIQMGHQYSIKELLRYMIVYSDNNATSLLFENMNLNLFKKVFTDVGLDAPDLTAQNYPITARDFSIFMRILYNSSYLSDKHSEFATELLSSCDFKGGLVSGFPSNVKVAHKFGEAGDPSEKQFSESAIVYLNNDPYLLTVMVKGKDYSKLPDIIKQISGIVYQNMTGMPTSS